MSFLRLSLTLLLATGALAGCARRKPAADAPATSVSEPAMSTVSARADARAAAAAPPAARDLTDVLTEELNLTTEQRSRVRQIFTSTLTQAQQTQQRLKADRPAMLAELKRLNAASDQELQQVLSAEQYQQLKAKQKQVQEQMRARKAQ
ncbi:hypothetical protein KLP40_08455 [Hymenobacter sp. NST-14]|uniref:hypothetical protein n=1 Tax=Hymenobacter piscis TaxID=2839984 RepID=UPI001C0304A6|nr:hypothetical protein [Hymenobacter piscis]MBT9393193.1 hypothetical protein [Hymenobacter piscis]